MCRIAITAMVSIVALAAGCASTAQYGRAINYDEASAFERSLLAREATGRLMPFPIYTQPVNKEEPCKLPTSKDQVERNNFRAYWDGQCKDGYASGLGRDIAISDTHHIEEITVHNGSAYNPDAPRVVYDFVNNKIEYTVPEGKYPKSVQFSEYRFNYTNGFYILYRNSVVDDNGDYLGAEWSPLSPIRTLINVRKNVLYKFTHNSAAQIINPSLVSFSAEIIDPQTMKPGGVAVFRYGNGQWKHFMLNGSTYEPIVIPPEYYNQLSEKLKAVESVQPALPGRFDRAKQIEREYLYMACNGKHTIKDLDKAISTKICTWRDQFKTPYENALAKYTQENERMKQQATNAEQQRLAQQQIAAQQARLDQQQSQQEMQQMVNTIGQMGQQALSTGQQMLQSTRQPAQQFQPITLPGSNQINCVNAGSVTNCRY